VNSGWLAVDERGALVEQLGPGGGELRERGGGPGTEDGGPVAVLEGEPDAVVPLDRGAHRVAGHQPQQLAARRLVGRCHLVVGELRLASLSLHENENHSSMVSGDGAD
jgi:hypothetical protein